MISTLSLTSPLRQSVQQAQAALAQAQTEVASGVQADLGLALGAGAGTSLSLKNETDSLTSYKATNGFAATRLSATSDALSALLATAQATSTALVTAASAGGSTSALQPSARAGLQSLSSGLNTSVGGQYIFGGINTDAAPIADYASTRPSAAKQAVDASFQQAFGTSQTSGAAGSISGTAMQAYLDNQFASQFSDASWQSNWSKASSQPITSTLSPGQKATTSVSANGAASRSLAQAYTMLAEFTGSNMSADARAAVVATAQKLIGAGIAGLTEAQGTVGLAQSAVTTADSQIDAKVAVLKTSVSSLESVDPYALSNKVTALQTQLESSYSLTSRLQQLSLVNYLTVG